MIKKLLTLTLCIGMMQVYGSAQIRQWEIDGADAFLQRDKRYDSGGIATIATIDMSSIMKESVAKRLAIKAGITELAIQLKFEIKGSLKEGLKSKSGGEVTTKSDGQKVDMQKITNDFANQVDDDVTENLIENKLDGVRVIEAYRRRNEEGQMQYAVLMAMSIPEVEKVMRDVAFSLAQSKFESYKNQLTKAGVEVTQEMETAQLNLYKTLEMSDTRKAKLEADKVNAAKKLEIDRLDIQNKLIDLDQKKATGEAQIEATRAETANKKAMTEAEIKNMNKEKEVKKPEVDPSAPVKKDDQ